MASSAEARHSRRSKYTRHLTFEGYTHFLSRIALLWLKPRSPVYSKLCPNVLREIASYLWFIPKLLVFNSNQLLSFDIRTKEVRTEYSPDGVTEATFCLIGAVYVGENKAFVAANLDGYCTFLLENGRMTDLPTLLRIDFGLVYDAPRHRVCVFGGRRRLGPFAKAKITRECQQLRLGDTQWRSLPRMQRYRDNFQPCWHKSLIYLYGFRNKDVETFDPRTDTFRKLPEFSLPNNWSSRFDLYYLASVPQSDEVAIFKDDKMILLDVETKGVTERKIEGSFNPNRCVGVACGRWLYYAQTKGMTWCKIHMISGRIEDASEKEH